MSLCRSVIPIRRQLRIFGGVYYQSSKSFAMLPKEPFKPKPYSLNQQSVLLPGPERIRASILAEDPTQPMGTFPGSPEVKTIYDVLYHGKKISNDGPCIGTKPIGSNSYHWSPYSTVISRTQDIGSGLVELGIKPKSNSYVGIFSANREEHLLTMYACCGYSMTLVPLYLTMGLPSVIYIINLAKLSIVISTNRQNNSYILNNPNEMPTVKTLVMCDEPTVEELTLAKSANIRVLTYAEMEQLGKANRKELTMPDPDDIFCIPFTSGTTGNPKGVMLSHKSLIACNTGLIYSYGESGRYGGIIISYLPPAHVYEICNEIASLYFGRAIAFYTGDIKNVVQEFSILKPDVVPLVPKIMSAIYTQVMKVIKESVIKSAIVSLALRQKEKLIKQGKTTEKSFWDKYILHQFQKLLGNPYLVVTTSAPVPIDVMRFYTLASGAYVHELYGSTEVLAAVMTLPNDTKLGYVGCPMVCSHIKLVDVPELDYYSKDDIGEICIKGPNVFKGYLDNPEATNEVLKDGWYHTGDIGKWLPNGALKIIDRKKHLFKLSQGEYIAPEKVENAYILCNLVQQIYVDGISGKDYIIALVYPDHTLLQKWLTNKGYNSPDLLETLTNEKVRRDFLLELVKYGKENHLNSLEQARNMAFLDEPLSVENKMLTPTLKVKRHVARKYFEKMYHKLYEEGPLIKSIK